MVDGFKETAFCKPNRTDVHMNSQNLYKLKPNTRALRRKVATKSHPSQEAICN